MELDLGDTVVLRSRLRGIVRWMGYVPPNPQKFIGVQIYGQNFLNQKPKRKRINVAKWKMEKVVAWITEFEEGAYKRHASAFERHNIRGSMLGILPTRTWAKLIPHPLHDRIHIRSAVRRLIRETRRRTIKNRQRAKSTAIPASRRGRAGTRKPNPFVGRLAVYKSPTASKVWSPKASDRRRRSDAAARSDHWRYPTKTRRRLLSSPVDSSLTAEGSTPIETPKARRESAPVKKTPDTTAPKKRKKKLKAPGNLFDGSLRGQKLFDCIPGTGIFIKINQIISKIGRNAGETNVRGDDDALSRRNKSMPQFVDHEAEEAAKRRIKEEENLKRRREAIERLRREEEDRAKGIEPQRSVSPFSRSPKRRGVHPRKNDRRISEPGHDSDESSDAHASDKEQRQISPPRRDRRRRPMGAVDTPQSPNPSDQEQQRLPKAVTQTQAYFGLKAHQIDDMRALFEWGYGDQDGDPYDEANGLVADDLCAAFEKLGERYSPTDMASIMAPYDVHGDGLLRFNEFLMLVKLQDLIEIHD